MRDDNVMVWVADNSVVCCGQRYEGSADGEWVTSEFAVPGGRFWLAHVESWPLAVRHTTASGVTELRVPARRAHLGGATPASSGWSYDDSDPQGRPDES